MMLRETPCLAWTRAQAIAAANPAQRHRILGIPRYYQHNATSHEITVDCLTGIRTVTKMPPRNSFAMTRASLHALMARVVEMHLETKEYLRQQVEINSHHATGPTTDRIMIAVARAAGLQPGDIYGGTARYRSLNVIHARHLYCYLVVSLRPDLSYPAVGRTFLKGRHHTTIMHAVAMFASKRRDIASVQRLCSHRAVSGMVAKADRVPVRARERH